MSKLNPEAAEFRPFGESELELRVEEGCENMKEATRSCNAFPIGASYKLFQTYTEFNVVISRLCNNVVFLSNRIMKGEASTALKCEDDDESNQERVSESLDALVDRVSGPVGDAPAPSTTAPGPSTAAWNRKPTLATVQVKAGGTSLLSAKNITRPQLAFREPVDNSDKLFVPRISDKPNAMRPLALTLHLGPDGQPAGYDHPYKLELTTWVPPQWAMGGGDEQPEAAARALGGGDEQPEAAARALDDTPLTMVETRAALDALLAHLDTVREIAVDLEHHSYRTYQGLTCLIQVSTDEGGDFILDALALRDHLHLLNHAFTHPDKIKVFHGADQDILWLQRDFGVYVVGLFDTHQAARALRLPHASLKHLLAHYCGVHTDKTHQLADWRMRPLPAELVRYARTDTHYLLSVWRRMRAELTPHALLDVFRASQRVARTTYNKPTLTADAHLAAYVRSGKRWGAAQLAALRALWAWRDAHARELDESPAYLLPTHMMLAVCEALPRDVQGLRALLEPPPPVALHHLHDMHQIILACRCVPEAPAAFAMPAAVRGMATTSVAHARPHHDLLASPLDTSESEHTVEASAWKALSCAPDVPAFCTTSHAHQRSQLNAAAASFLPPYQRYRVYRLSAQAEEEAALLATRARAEVVGRGNEVVRAAVLEPLAAVLEPLAAAVKVEPAESAPASPPVHEYRKPPPSPRKRKHRAEAAGGPYDAANYARLRTARLPAKPNKHRKAE